MVVFSLGLVLSIVAVSLLVGIGWLNTISLWIANNQGLVIAILGIVVLIKILVFESRTKGALNRFFVFLLCPLVHIPFVKFLFVLTDNILNKTGLISVFLAPIGRSIAVAFMLMFIYMADATFFTGGISTENQDSHVSDYVVASIASIVLSIITTAIYIYW